MPIERREIMFFFPEVQAALQRARHAPGGEAIPAEIDHGAIFEAIHTGHSGRSFHDLGVRIFAGIDRALLKQGGVVLRASRTGGVPRRDDFTFFVPDQVMREALALECRHRGIMLPAGVGKEVIADLLTVGLRITIGEELDDLGEPG